MDDKFSLTELYPEASDYLKKLYESKKPEDIIRVGSELFRIVGLNNYCFKELSGESPLFGTTFGLLVSAAFGEPRYRQSSKELLKLLPRSYLEFVADQNMRWAKNVLDELDKPTTV